jgi:hypothetical protein
MSSPPSLRTSAIPLGAVLLLTAVVQAAAYWPGLMTWDSIRQYGQALSGDFDDWHPPAMGWLWRQLTAVRLGPSPMLLLQLALYWAGFGLFVAWAIRSRRRGLAIALVMVALFPISLALMGAVLKDCLMAGALLSASGLLLWVRPDRDLGLRFVAMALLIAAATLRFNAAFACLPLFMALLPRRFLRTPARFAAAGAVAAILLFLAMPVANRLIGAKPSGVALSLVIFDLGGITEQSGVDVFPTLPVKNPVAVNHGCYSPVKWDTYSYWVDPLCPIGFDLIRKTMEDRHQSATLFWMRAIVSHPIAYAEHRLNHFNINTRFLVHDEIERPVQIVSVPNEWKYEIRPSAALTMFDAAARATAVSPLGWPITWIALALGVLMLAWRQASARITVPLALSSFLYGAGYLFVSVAAEIRYHLWTMIAAMIAGVFCAHDLWKKPNISRRRIAIAALPVVVVIVLGGLWRILAAPL